MEFECFCCDYQLGKIIQRQDTAYRKIGKLKYVSIAVTVQKLTVINRIVINRSEK